MTTRRRSWHRAAPTYVVRVAGHLDAHWSASLGEVWMAQGDDGTTTITVPEADQARLHGVLACLRDIGTVLLELRTLDAESTAMSSRRATRPTS